MCGGGGESRKNSAVKGGRHYMKNKNIRGGGGKLSTQPDRPKKTQFKNAQKCKKLSNIEKIFLARFAHSAFYIIHISGAANRHAPVQYAKYVVVFKQSS